MPKYVIEGDANFYYELYKSLDENESTESSNDSSSELCLITNAPLQENYVTLACNHKFNYNAIYNDIYCHKKKYNSMERLALKNKEIRCPYCRTIHKTLLPYVEGYQQVHGVNFYDETQELSQVYKNNINVSEYSKGSCCYVPPTSNPIDDVLNPPPKCNNCYVKAFQLDGKTYCGGHYRIRTKEVYYANKLKEKNEKKQAVIIEKQKIRDEKIKAKLEEKLMKQAEQLKKKAENASKTNAKIKPKQDDENLIISSSQQQQQQQQTVDVLDETKCIEILKTGTNKGKQCGCKIVSNGLCGRHNKSKKDTSTEPDVKPECV